MRSIHTDILEIAFEDGGPEQGPPVLLLHGWPDAPRGWNEIVSRLQARGWRTIVPYLRGSGPTRFRSPSTPRIGTAVALAQDAIELADALDLERFAVVGHDWGGRIAYTLAALFPERVTAVAAMALGYQPRGVFRVPGAGRLAGCGHACSVLPADRRVDVACRHGECEAWANSPERCASEAKLRRVSHLPLLGSSRRRSQSAEERDHRKRLALFTDAVETSPAGSWRSTARRSC